MSKQSAAADFQIDGTPAIPGLTFRSFRDNTDFAAIAEILHTAKDIDQMDQAPSVDEIMNDYDHLDNFVLSRDLLLAALDGRIVGYSGARWSEEPDRTRLYKHWGSVHPDWRGKGIGRALLGAMEQHLRRTAAEHPPDVPGFFQVFLADTQTSRVRMLRRAGYTPVAYFAEMLRPDLENIPDLPLPEPVELRPVLPEHYRLIWEADREASRDHWGYSEDEYSEDAFQGWLNNPVVFQPALWCIVWDGDQVVGMVRSFINVQENEEYERKWGYTEFISVRKPWRRRGIARALLCQSLRILKQQGMEAANLGVHTDNPHGAFKLYTDIGFQTIRMWTVSRKPLHPVED